MSAGFQGMFKAEVARISRKATASEIGALEKKVTEQRRSIASLRREVEELRRLVKSQAKLTKPTARFQAAPEGEGEEVGRLRFRADSFASLRQKLGLSAAQMGKLIGASGLSVYKWEKGQAHPRKSMLTKIAQVRGLGKREALAKLAELE